jgi:type 1 glutamine amidotransferase
MKFLFTAHACLAMSLFAQGLPPEAQQKIESAVPWEASARPKKARKLLVLNFHDSHASTPYGKLALELMGTRTGAFQAVFSGDVGMLTPENLDAFDAICFLNTAGMPSQEPALPRSLLRAVRGGKGFIGLHASAAASSTDSDFGEMLGACAAGGHPWRPTEAVTLKLDDPVNPVNAAFERQGFEVADEIFQFREPYSRERLHVLLSIDTLKTNMDPKRGFLPERWRDKDFPLSWIRSYGKGRVFYTSLGHNVHIYWNAALLRHFLDGIQFALGDLEAADAPGISQPAR